MKNQEREKLQDAFPNEYVSEGARGMTLRDYFANSSDIPWNALIETIEIKSPELKGKVTVRMVLELRAEYKYLEADAMLKQREL